MELYGKMIFNRQIKLHSCHGKWCGKKIPADSAKAMDWVMIGDDR